eukprot:GDKI01014089.1.p1 GENE.GDKI01014089.1~~GDKI01014089.1.p1  ORF type:complete len:140 (-),score=25.68 GDKI01014089.1:4-423(-)
MNWQASAAISVIYWVLLAVILACYEEIPRLLQKCFPSLYMHSAINSTPVQNQDTIKHVRRRNHREGRKNWMLFNCCTGERCGGGGVFYPLFTLAALGVTFVGKFFWVMALPLYFHVSFFSVNKGNYYREDTDTNTHTCN